LSTLYKDKILNLLRTSRAGFLSGEELARKCGISRTMVWKHIKSLEQDGFGINAVPSQGYRITAEPDILRKSDILSELNTAVLGKNLHLVSKIQSTNTLAMDIATQGAPEGTVVLAEVQTAGKGRLGRSWFSPKGNIYLSVILRPNIPLQKSPLVTLMGSVAVATAIQETCNLPALIKWPNDVYIQGKKVSGLLTEMSAEQDRIRHLVLGIGINANMDCSHLPDDVRLHTTTLAAETHSHINRTMLVRQLLQSLDHWYRQFLSDDQDVLKEWKKLNITLGKRVMVTDCNETFEGQALGIDKEGRLIIKRDNDTTQHIAAGDVSLKS